jgi:phosphatidylglycerophosphate synthase
MNANPTPGARRPIKARETKWASKIAAYLAKAGVRPNTISVLSAGFAAGAGGCLAASAESGRVAAACLFVAAALGIQLRLLCNLFDGMVAVEGGFRTKSGEIFNELPDRFADAFILIGAGYAASSVQYGVTLGWAAAVLAVITAYVRTLGAAAGAGQCFLGPMAKQHRMAVMTAACVLAAVGVFMNAGAQVVSVALVIVVSGTLLTIVRRTRHIIQTLEAS